MNRTSTLLRLAVLTCILPLAAHAQDAAKPVHGYRVTYTLTTTDSGKQVGLEHFAMTVDTAPAPPQEGPYSGRGSIKVGQKIPIETGNSSDGKSDAQIQFTYIDVGTSIDATVTEAPDGLLIASKVEQSSVAPEPVTVSGVSEPLIRQTVLTNSSTLTPGKGVSIGSLDLPDTKRHIDIEVSVERLP